MKLFPLIIALSSLLICASLECNAEKNAVILIIDGLGSTYIYPGNEAYFVEGGKTGNVSLSFIDTSSYRAELKTIIPQTEIAHSVLVTGYTKATNEEVSYYSSTIFDAVKEYGYITIGIMEKGDSDNIINEQDIVVREKNNSVYEPHIERYLNNASISADIIRHIDGYRSPESRKHSTKDKYGAYTEYNKWAIKFGEDTVRFMNKTLPSSKFLLTINAGGLDSAGHSTGYKGYLETIKGLDEPVSDLIKACNETGTVLMITGDHGMSFKHEYSKGSHSSFEVASRNESLLTPFLIYTDSEVRKSNYKIYGQECFAPTALSLMECPNTLTMCNAATIPVLEEPALYIRSAGPANITITGMGIEQNHTINGIQKVSSLEKGVYTISSGGIVKNIMLDSDMVVDIYPDNDTVFKLPEYTAYLLSASAAFAGIIFALRLFRSRK
jgi:hypothetical protein